MKTKNYGKGVRIEFSYNQLRENKNGGLLNELLEFVGNNIPFANKVIPIIRKKELLLSKIILFL